MTKPGVPPRRSAKGGQRHSGKEGIKKNGVAKHGKIVSHKNRIRSLQRLLSRPGLPDPIRRKTEKQLAEIQEKAAAHQKALRERKIAKKYHKVKFFERAKLERRLKVLENQISHHRKHNQDVPLELLQAVDQVRQDIQYVKYFPRGERYVSLLRDADDPAGQARLEAERARLRALVRRQVADLAMLTQPDEGVGAAASLPGPTTLAANSDDGAASDDFFLDPDEEAEEAAEEAADLPAANQGLPRDPAAAPERPVPASTAKEEIQGSRSRRGAPSSAADSRKFSGKAPGPLASRDEPSSESSGEGDGSPGDSRGPPGGAPGGRGVAGDPGRSGDAAGRLGKAGDRKRAAEGVPGAASKRIRGPEQWRVAFGGGGGGSGDARGGEEVDSDEEDGSDEVDGFDEEDDLDEVDGSDEEDGSDGEGQVELKGRWEEVVANGQKGDARGRGTPQGTVPGDRRRGDEAEEDGNEEKVPGTQGTRSPGQSGPQGQSRRKGGKGLVAAWLASALGSLRGRAGGPRDSCPAQLGDSEGPGPEPLHVPPRAAGERSILADKSGMGKGKGSAGRSADGRRGPGLTFSRVGGGGSHGVAAAEDARSGEKKGGVGTSTSGQSKDGVVVRTKPGSDGKGGLSRGQRREEAGVRGGQEGRVSADSEGQGPGKAGGPAGNNGVRPGLVAKHGTKWQVTRQASRKKAEKTPLRTRAEGGRKRRRKKR